VVPVSFIIKKVIMNKAVIKYSFKLLNADYVKLGSEWNFKNVISPYYRLYYIDDGEGVISGPNDSVKLSPGNLYLIPSFTHCNLHCESTLGQYFVQFFEESSDGISLFANCREIFQSKADFSDIENFKRLIAINPGRGLERSTDPVVYEKDIYYREFIELNNLQSAAVQYETQGIIFQLISKFLKPDIFNRNKQETRPPVVLDAMEYIQRRLGEPLKVSQLAHRANLSVDYFSKIFHLSTGQSPINYILQKKIERAQYLITTTEKQQGEIAELTGFENVQHFSRVFKRITGLTPGAYKNQNMIPNYTDR
jgi:AraC-like DNA-binding protein